jgi:hypothetical protein
MFITLKKSLREFHPDKQSILNLILFILLSTLMPMFTLGYFNLSKDATADGSLTFFYEFGKYYPGIAPALYISIPLSLLYIVLATIFYQRMKKEVEDRKRALSIIFFIFVIIRAISIFSFPYGEIDYTYISPFNSQEILVHYEGYSIQSRITNLLYDSCFYSYFVLFFYSIKAIAKKNRFIFHLIYIAIELVVISMIVYSLIKEMDLYIFNFKKIFIDPLDSPSPLQSIASFVNHRNAYGFFLMIGSIYSLAEFFEKENILSFILCAIYYFLCLLIFSKTPFLLLTGTYLLMFILYPIFHYKRNPGWSTLFVILLVAIVSFVLISYLFYKESVYDRFIKPLIEHLTHWSTMSSRRDITQSCLSMMNNPFYILFGYSKYPFMTIFRDYNKVLPIDHTVDYSTHNSFGDIFMYFGLVGLLFAALFFGYLIRKLWVMLFKKKDYSAIRYLVLIVVILVYSYSEPRFILLEEGSAIIFSMMLSFPYVLRRESRNKEILLKNL